MRGGRALTQDSMSLLGYILDLHTRHGAIMAPKAPFCKHGHQRGAAPRRARLEWAGTPKWALCTRALALLTRLRGAKQGANDHRHTATSGHIQPLLLQLDGTSGHTGRCHAASRDCLLSSRSRVRVALGAQIMQVERSSVSASR